jgi:hypothetical protein
VDGKLEIFVDTDDETENLSLTLKFPQKEMSFKGDLESLRTLATSELTPFKSLLSAGGLQDLKSDLYRIYTQVKKEFDDRKSLQDTDS